MSSSFMVQFQKDEVILRQGEQQKSIYKLISGTVAFYTNYGKADQMKIGTRSVPDYFGEIMLLANQPTYCTIVAESAITALRVSEEDFAHFLQRDTQNIFYMVQAMTENLQMLQMDIDQTQLMQQIAQAATQVVLDLGILQSILQPEIAEKLRLYFGQDGEIQANEEKKQTLQELYLPGHKDYSQVHLPDCTPYLYEKEYHCPHCGQTFSGMCISTARLTPIHDGYGNERYDFRMIYENFRSEWYDIVTCPHCYFSAFSDTFQTHEIPSKGRYAAKLAEVRAALPADFMQQQTLDRVFTQHYVALICADAFRNELMSRAQIWRNISWLYEDQKDTELMEEAMQRTVEAYEAVYSYCELTEAQMQRILLVISGIYYHKGERQEARQRLHQVKTLRGGKPIYTNMADRLIQIIREEMDEEEFEARRGEGDKENTKKPWKSFFGAPKQEK